MIEIVNIDRTKLSETALLKLIKKFAKSSKNIRLSFDAKISPSGCYSWNAKKQRHEIQISISSKVFEFKDVMSRTHEIIGTILHELKHLRQQEKLGTHGFFSKSFTYNQRIKNKEASLYFSIKEVEARIFEEKNLHAAIAFYCKNIDAVVD